MRVRAQEVVVQQLMGSRLNVLDHVVCLEVFDNICLEPIMTVPMSGRTMKHFLQDRNRMSEFPILTNSILYAILLLSANNNLKRVLPHIIDIHWVTPPLPFSSPSPDLHIRSRKARRRKNSGWTSLSLSTRKWLNAVEDAFGQPS